MSDFYAWLAARPDHYAVLMWTLGMMAGLLGGWFLRGAHEQELRTRAGEQR